MFHILTRRKTRPPNGDSVAALFHYRQGRQFNAGAESEVYIDNRELPLLKATGTGVVYKGLRVTQPTPLYFQRQVGINGIGTIAGQFILQPLFDPSNPET